MLPQEKMIFCTLFDSNYLDKGLALYYSMIKHIDIFKLYIFAFDKKCNEVLSSMRLKNVIVLSVEDIMTDRLQLIQQERTHAEFCWTCTPLVIEYVLEKCGEKICTYIDADIYFFANPKNAIQEIIDNRCSVGLVEHRFEKNCECGSHIFNVGKYCIQFNTFINDNNGMEVLTDWKENCLDWCYCRFEDGKYGDQKYPDKWKQRYSCIYEVQDLGVGVAPWNLHVYSYSGRKKGKIWLKYRNRLFPVVFFHFEGMRYLSNGYAFLNLWNPCALGTSRKVSVLYGEYFKIISSIRKYLNGIYSISFDHMLVEKKLFFGREYMLKEFCKNNGILDGCQKWVGYWTNNIMAVSKLSKRRG